MGNNTAKNGSSSSSTSDSLPNMKKFRTPEGWTEFFNQKKGQPNKLVVVDFSASWCGPCKFMEPVFEALASKYPNVVFVKLDVDELPDVAKANNIQAMPTFVLFKGGIEKGRIIGAKKEDLEKKIAEFKD